MLRYFARWLPTGGSRRGELTRTSHRRLLLLSLLAAVIGLLGGGAAWVLVHLIGLFTNLALYQRWGWNLPDLGTLETGPLLVVAAVGGGAVVSLLARWSPTIRGHGIPEAMEAVLTDQSRISPRTALAKPLSAAVAIGTGGPFGAEGPIIVTGGALGSLIGQVLRMSASERKILLASGAAAGMAATFGAPLASVILAIELLLFEFSTRAFVPLVVAASLAAGMHSLLFGSGPLFSVPSHDFAGLEQLPLYAFLGLGCGFLAVLISKGLFAVEAGFRRLPVSEAWHPVIGAVGFALVGLAVPRALGVGYGAIGDVLNSELAVGTLAVLVGAKLVAWWVALGSGTSGGTLAPVLLISAGFGSLAGSLVGRMAPGLGVSPGAFAVVAMAATFGGATRAPFASIVFVFELTRDYEIMLPLMLAAVLAHLVAGVLLEESLMTEKLARRGLRVHADYEPDVFRTTTVGQVMTRQVESIPANLGVSEALGRLAEGDHGSYPVIDDDGRCIGVLERDDLVLASGAEDQLIGEVVSHEVVAVHPGDTALVALQRIVDDEVAHLPVLDAQGRPVGICTRGDLLRARWRQLELERRQPGWRPGRSSDGSDDDGGRSLRRPQPDTTPSSKGFEEAAPGAR